MNLFVTNLSNDVDDTLFRSVFEPFGTILSAKVMLDIHTGISRGFGFVLYEREEDGLRAMTELQGKPVGRNLNPLVVTRAQTHGYNAVNNTTKIHVRNVPKEVSQDEMRALFAVHGKIERMAIREDGHDTAQPEHREWLPSTLVVFLQYAQPAEASLAVNKLHNSRPWPNMKVPLLAKPAETAEMRTQRKARQDQRRKEQMHKSTPTRTPEFHSAPPMNVMAQYPPQMVMSPSNMPTSQPQMQQIIPQQLIPMQHAQQMGPGTVMLVQSYPQPQQVPMPYANFPAHLAGSASLESSLSFSSSWNWSPNGTAYMQPNMVWSQSQSQSLHNPPVGIFPTGPVPNQQHYPEQPVSPLVPSLPVSHSPVQVPLDRSQSPRAAITPIGPASHIGGRSPQQSVSPAAASRRSSVGPESNFAPGGFVFIPSMLNYPQGDGRQDFA